MKEAAKRNPDPIYDSIGDSGKWQFLIVLLIALSKLPIAWHLLSTIVIAPPTKFQCGIPDNDTDACSEDCKEVVYDRSIFQKTAITEWNLICDKELFPNIGQTIFMFGILLGNVGFGIWADKVGRRIPLGFSVCLQLIAGVLAAIAPWYWLFVLLRFLCAVATGGNMLTTFCIVMEIVGPGKREFFLGILNGIPFHLGHVFLSPIAYFVRDFRWFQFTISIFSVVLLSYICLIPESPRWLILAGRTDEAVAVLEKAATINKIPTKNIRRNVEEAIQARATKPEGQKGNLADLLRTPNLRRNTLCIFFNWFAVGFNFYGISQYIGQLGGNIFFNIAISGFFGVPGSVTAVLTCKYLGRKPTLITANLFIGIGMLLFIFIPKSLGTLQVVLASFGIYGSTVCFSSCYLYAGEIFPTSARNLGMGMSSMLARFGAMSAAHVSSFKKFAEWLPPSIFATIGLSAMFLVLLLPETLGKPLPDTTEDSENFGKKTG